MKKIPFLDLRPQYKQIRKDFSAFLAEAMERSDFILGRDVALFEEAFARFCGRRYAVGVNSGTDALFLGLLSMGIGPGDEVIVPAFTYIATALAVTYTGARPVFVDIEESTYNIDARLVEAAVTPRTRALIPVHLYGHPADMRPLLRIAAKRKLKVIEDTAQAHGAGYRAGGRWEVCGGMGDVGCFSFYPTKNLGAFGDGGIVVTDDQKAHKKLLMLRDYGRRSRYEHVTLGYNSRLDTVQAAFLRAKLPHLNAWNRMRRSNAKAYNRYLGGASGIIVPQEAGYARHVYHIYAVRVGERDVVARRLAEEGIGVLIHYPIPLHLQEVYKGLGYRRGDFPVAERIAGEIISLPMYPHLTEQAIRRIAGALKRIVKETH